MHASHTAQAQPIQDKLLTLGAHAQRGLLWSLGSFFPSVCSTNISPVRRPGVKMKA